MSVLRKDIDRNWECDGSSVWLWPWTHPEHMEHMERMCSRKTCVTHTNSKIPIEGNRHLSGNQSVTAVSHSWCKPTRVIHQLQRHNINLQSGSKLISTPDVFSSYGYIPLWQLLFLRQKSESDALGLPRFGLKHLNAAESSWVHVWNPADARGASRCRRWSRARAAAGSRGRGAAAHFQNSSKIIPISSLHAGKSAVCFPVAMAVCN